MSLFLLQVSYTITSKEKSDLVVMYINVRKKKLVCQVYLKRLKSGPIEEFAKADKDTPILTNPHVIPH